MKIEIGDVYIITTTDWGEQFHGLVCLVQGYTDDGEIAFITNEPIKNWGHGNYFTIDSEKRVEETMQRHPITDSPLFKALK